MDGHKEIGDFKEYSSELVLENIEIEDYN